VEEYKHRLQHAIHMSGAVVKRFLRLFCWFLDHTIACLSLFVSHRVFGQGQVPFDMRASRHIGHSLLAVPLPLQRAFGPNWLRTWQGKIGKKPILVYFILPISKEASSASILGRVWCDVSSRKCLARLSALMHTASVFCFYFRVLRVVWVGICF
jgi:hypothetical protein